MTDTVSETTEKINLEDAVNLDDTLLCQIYQSMDDYSKICSAPATWMVVMSCCHRETPFCDGHKVALEGLFKIWDAIGISKCNFCDFPGYAREIFKFRLI